MSFDYRELMTQVLANHQDQDEDQDEDRRIGCQLCSTTAPPGCQQCATTIPPGCEQCATTQDQQDRRPCNVCSTTRQAVDAWSQHAQDLALLHQQLRDSLAAG
jgi:hypothetical protein